MFINEKIIKKYLEKRSHIKNLYKEASYLKRFLVEVESYYSISLENEKSLLERITYKESMPKKSRNGYVPYKYLRNLIEKIEQDLDDLSISIDRRIVIGLIGIAIYTGMRCEELSLLKRGHLDELIVGDKKIYYLRFKTFKTTGKNIEYRNTSCHIEEDGAKIYRKVEILGDELIENLSKTTMYKAYYYYYTGEYIKNKKELPQEYKTIVDNLTLEVKNDLKYKMKQYLWLNRYGKVSKGSTTLAGNIRKYFANSFESFGVDYLTDAEKQHIKSFSIENERTYSRLLDIDTQKKIPFEKAKEQKFYYVNTHQLRSTLCTNLYKQNVPIDYIMKHMNHLSQDMTMYYNRVDLFVDEVLECLEILKDFTDNNINNTSEIKVDKDLESQDIVEDLKRINDFLDKNKLNINSDLEKIKKILKLSNSDIVINDFGICIKSVVSGICERRKYFTQYYSKLYYGVNLLNYNFLDLHYKRFNEQLNIYNHNLLVGCNSVEISRQKNCIKSYIIEVLIKEINLLEKDIELKGRKQIQSEFIQLADIINNLDKIKKEINRWIY